MDMNTVASSKTPYIFFRNDYLKRLLKEHFPSPELHGNRYAMGDNNSSLCEEVKNQSCVKIWGMNTAVDKATKSVGDWWWGCWRIYGRSSQQFRAVLRDSPYIGGVLWLCEGISWRNGRKSANVRTARWGGASQQTLWINLELRSSTLLTYASGLMVYEPVSTGHQSPGSKFSKFSGRGKKKWFWLVNKSWFTH